MDPLALARLQFAITTVYHFFFVPLTLGLSLLVALMETFYVATGRDVYRQMTKFWGKLFVINFAMGVVTGIVQEFQFGMNWSEYSRFVGDIFGAPLAIEALLAFFIESTFLGIWIFGWEKLSKKMHLAAIWLVAIGSSISAFWILIANSFMQEPVGYTLNAGRAEMTSFSDLILNPNIFHMFPHTLLSGLVTAAFFIMGITAYHLLRKTNEDLFRRSFNIGAIVGCISIVLLIINGHAQTQHMVRTQPMKMAAAEGLWKSEDPAPLSLLTINNWKQTEEVFSIRIPGLLSFLAYNKFSGEVKGLNDLQAEQEELSGPGDYTPNLVITYWSFRTMVGLGFLLAGLAILAIVLVMRKKLNPPARLVKIFTWAIILPYLANTTGWLLTEVGRFPWLVYKVLKLDQGVSNMVTGAQVLTTLIGFTLIYAALMVATIYLLSKFATAGPAQESTPDASDQLPSLVGTI
jgi:cytochrome d ubiquinol oxidase subunit I